jgi:hypothetical protein
MSSLPTSGVATGGGAEAQRITVPFGRSDPISRAGTRPKPWVRRGWSARSSPLPARPGISFSATSSGTFALREAV